MIMRGESDMSLVLGVDIGGIYMDVVLIRDEVEVIVFVKFFIICYDLVEGIGGVVEVVLS